MRKTMLLLIVWMAAVAASAQTLRNPIIPGYHPDPSICRVGNDFYLVNSSFQYFPGVPVFHSTDLVNWTPIGNVLNRESQLPLKGASSWLGIYAPTIRYHEGTYYMITTNVGNGGNFMVTAKDPKGPWSEPMWLQQQGIDPSLWFEDGKCYMMSNPDNTILLCEIDPATGRQLTESRPLWQGTGGRYPEGPHIYKKDGYYYLLISEGGTELAHSLTIARSQNIYGPYESNPDNPILTNCNRKGQSMQIQGTGHGDFVQAADGSWWIVFLAYRNFGGSYHHLGRETCLAPVEWKEGEWPVVNGGNPIDTLMQVPALLGTPRDCIKHQHDICPDDPQWLYIQNPITANYRFAEGGVTLTASASTLTENNRPTFIGRRQESSRMVMETEIDVVSLDKGCEAGLTVYQIHDGHLDLSVVKDGTGRLKVQAAATVKTLHQVESVPLDKARKVHLRVTATDGNYVFEYAADGAPFAALSQQSCTLVSTEVVGGFTGVVVGMYAQGSGSAHFGYFDYAEW